LWLLARLRELLTLLALGSLSIWLIPQGVQSSSHSLRKRPLPSFGWGLLGLIIGYTAVFVTAILLFLLGILLAIVTLGGLAGAVFGIGFSGLIMVMGIFTLLVIYGSKIVCCYLMGGWVVSRFSSEDSNLRLVTLVVGIAIYMAFRLIPIVSIIVGIIATLFGLGAMVLAFKNRKKEKVIAPVLEQSEVASE
jgi:ABC-type antimicrobial peptide transport system permease subunit